MHAFSRCCGGGRSCRQLQVSFVLLKCNTRTHMALALLLPPTQASAWYALRRTSQNPFGRLPLFADVHVSDRRHGIDAAPHARSHCAERQLAQLPALISAPLGTGQNARQKRCAGWIRQGDHVQEAQLSWAPRGVHPNICAESEPQGAQGERRCQRDPSEARAAQTQLGTAATRCTIRRAIRGKAKARRVIKIVMSA